jgi:hypothetical protein
MLMTACAPVGRLANCVKIGDDFCSPHTHTHRRGVINGEREEINSIPHRCQLVDDARLQFQSAAEGIFINIYWHLIPDPQ